MSTTNKLKASAFNQGINQWNRLEVDLKGNRATFFINGTNEGYLTGEPPSGGGFVGLGGRSPTESEATFQFRDFTISE